MTIKSNTSSAENDITVVLGGFAELLLKRFMEDIENNYYQFLTYLTHAQKLRISNRCFITYFRNEEIPNISLYGL